MGLPLGGLVRKGTHKWGRGLVRGGLIRGGTYKWGGALKGGLIGGRGL